MTAENDRNIEELIAKLADSDGIQREKARNELVEIGGIDVVRALIIAINDHRPEVRFEAAKALIALGDPIAASALAHHLHDVDGDIRRLVAGGMAKLGKDALMTTLTSAIHYASDSGFCEAAHQAFQEFKKYGVHPELMDSLISACEDDEPGVSLPVAAFNALEAIRSSD